MKRYLRIIVLHGREKPLTVCPTGIEAPIVSRIWLLETNQKSERSKPLTKTSIHNLAHDVIVLRAFLRSPRLCSILEVEVFGQELVVSSPYCYGIFELADQRHLSPISSIKPSRNHVFYSLPHENEMVCDFACGEAECVGLQSQVSTGVGFF